VDVILYPKKSMRMSRLANSRSRVALFGLWLLIASTAADAANLDDLFGSALVLHDDQDVTAGVPQQIPWGQHPVATKESHRALGHSFMVIDQDSPSLAAVKFADGLVAGTTIAEDRPLLLSPHRFHDSLHIKLRTLII
jgi:hypothetical protein